MAQEFKKGKNEIVVGFTVQAYFLIPMHIGAHRGLKVVVHILNKFGAGQKKWSTYIYIISGRGRKSGGAIALVALVRWAPLLIYKASLFVYYCKNLKRLIYLPYT